MYFKQFYKKSLQSFYSFTTASSLYTKVPKIVSVQTQSSFLTKIFQNTKSAPSYLLLKQLFEYLKKSQILKQQFPFIKSDARFEENWMIIHALLLKKRLIVENQYFKTISTAQIEKFNYNIQTYFFADYGEYLNPHIPVKNFAKHFIQVYMKKLELFEQIERQNQRQYHLSSQKQQKQVLVHYGQLLKRIIYQDRVKMSDLQLMKMCKYYAAHTRYLNSLEWEDLLNYKIKWGFEGDIQLIQKF